MNLQVNIFSLFHVLDFKEIHFFLGLKPATPAFDEKWKEISKKYSDEFQTDQHQFMKSTHYDPAVKQINDNIKNRGSAVQDAIWSLSVLRGGETAGKWISSVTKGMKTDATDAQIIDKIYTEQIKKIPEHWKNSPKLHPSLKNRFMNEKKELMKMVEKAPGKEATKKSN